MGRVGGWLARVLGAVPASEMDGIRLTGRSWEFSRRQIDPAEFFRALPPLVTKDSKLVLEGGAPPPQVRQFLSEHGVTPDVKVARGTAWPRTPVFHVPATPL